MSKHEAARRGRSGCPTGKVRFRDGQEAKRSLGNIRAGKGELRTQVPTRWYECEVCLGVHLSHRDG